MFEKEILEKPGYLFSPMCRSLRLSLQGLPNALDCQSLNAARQRQSLAL